jgi:UPF0755 protein
MRIVKKMLFCCALLALFLCGVCGYGVYRVVRHFSRPPAVEIPPRPEVTLTIPEGFTLKQIGERVLAVDPAFENATFEAWQDAVGPHSPLEEDSFMESAGKPESVDLEGYLFPDTYRFFVDATAQEIAQTLLSTMERRVEALSLPTGRAENYSVHQLLTVASILEREVRTPEDMKEVADILYKRLEAGIALQCDSTINYVINGNDPSVSLQDIHETDSPYNTYKHRGLPPGPISNPGFAALTAAWHPSSNNFYYFLTDAQGNVHYAKTFEEHVRNKQKYLR